VQARFAARFARIPVVLVGLGPYLQGLGPIGLLLSLGGCGYLVAIVVPSSSDCWQGCSKDC
jgi:hypothetical protein